MPQPPRLEDMEDGMIPEAWPWKQLMAGDMECCWAIRGFMLTPWGERGRENYYIIPRDKKLLDKITKK